MIAFTFFACKCCDSIALFESCVLITALDLTLQINTHIPNITKEDAIITGMMIAKDIVLTPLSAITFDLSSILAKPQIEKFKDKIWTDDVSTGESALLIDFPGITIQAPVPRSQQIKE